ncbi:sensor histidine kinase [Paractinoplanes lichenicola]|uniref:Signal transduction histidine kinase subgroup 3 dimerisation and phosphoacceptor domain-containing protein n=1 Tax=Paractinoplanes lichenicola TaxID=2802976 RepID=A0ABS1VT32_9ACTN|nr:histidine kinase [Actinoplanes lichenicola]MBL7257619.1 hypothetical protein [Actinoplanes lichenicola]
MESTRAARVVVDTLIVATCVSAGAYVLMGHEWRPALVAAVLLLSALAAVQLWFSRASERLHTRRAYGLLALQAGLCCLPVLYFGYSWLALPSLTAATALLVLRPRWSVPLLLVVGCGTMAYAWHVQGEVRWSDPLSMVVFMLHVYGFTRLGLLVADLHRTRRALGEAAVAEERLRFARELQARLATSLRTIEARARQRPAAVAELVTIARTALAGMREFAQSYREPPPAGPLLTAPRVWFADGLLYGLLGLWLTGMIVILLERRDWSVATALGIACSVACIGLQAGWLSRPDRVRPARFALVAQAAVVLMPMVVVDGWAVSGRGQLAGSCLLVLRGAYGWAAFAAVVVVDGVWRLSRGPAHLGEQVTFFTGTIVIGLAVYAMTWNARLVRDLVRLRADLARAAVAAERMRFARDLHDLLGLSLFSISLKAQLARRLPAEAADAELAEIAGIARTARAEIDLVTAGDRELDLDDELRAARAMLPAADITADPPPLPPEIQTVLATVLREGVTNVIRHGDARTCSIRLFEKDGVATLDIVNDAARPGGDPPGAGLTNLAERVAALDGTFQAGPTAGSRFRLHVSVAVP